MQEVVPVKKKVGYRTVRVQSVDAGKLVEKIGPSGRCIVAIDVAKEAMVAGFADGEGRCQALVRFSHPTQTRLFLTLVTTLRGLGLTVEVAMEPTGVYGDVLRYQLGREDVPVFRVDPNRAHAMAQVLDGVPSLHDPKSCTLIAYLHAQGISARWQDKGELEREMRTLIDERDLFARPFEVARGQLEALLARHFPELSDLIDPSCAWHLHLLAQFPSPAQVAAAPEQVEAHLSKVSRGRLSSAKIDSVLRRARESLGVPVSKSEASLISKLTRYMLELRDRMKEVDRRIREALEARPELQWLVAMMGAGTTAATLADAGNPSDYGSCAAFEKALGLNLKEKTSGKSSDDPRLRITKRGSARVRRYLYLAALRLIQADPVVCAWYQKRKAFKAGLKIKAVVAVMRKLARAMVHVARGAPFDATKLFDVARLQLTDPASTTTSLAAT